MRNWKSIIASCALLFITASSTIIPVSASALDKKTEDLMLDYAGTEMNGINIYHAEDYSTQEKASQMKIALMNNSEYVAYSNLPKEQTQVLMSYNYRTAFNFSPYIDDSGKELDTCSIFFYKPVWNECYRELSTTGVLDDSTFEAMLLTTAVVDMKDAKRFDELETFSDMWGDNIPLDIKTGYVRATIPEDTEMVLLATSIRRYFRIPLSVGENLIKLQQEHYKIISIGGVIVDHESDVVCYFDTGYGDVVESCDFYVLSSNSTPDKAVELSMRRFMIDHGLYTPEKGKSLIGDIKEFEQEPQKEEKKKNLVGPILAIIVIAGSLTALVYIFINKTKENEEVDDGDEYNNEKS